MAVDYDLGDMAEASQSREVVFAGDSVRLAGQIDYPGTPAPLAGYPLIFVLHHAGGNTRSDYSHYADIALECGYSIFRWDKRGTGRSGAGGKGSTLNDAIMAFETAVSQPGIDRNRVVILAQGEGTLMLSDLFDQFSRLNPPLAALLIANLLDERDILKIQTKVQIIIGEDDWISWQVYGKASCEAHNETYPTYGARFSVAHHADRLLKDTRYDDRRIHIGAKHIIKDWLVNLE